jgi:hypothetical protein
MEEEAAANTLSGRGDYRTLASFLIVHLKFLGLGDEKEGTTHAH